MVFPDNTPSYLDKDPLPFEMGYLPPLFQKKAEIELGETPETIERCMKTMRELVSKEKIFKGLVVDDDYLKQYLRGKKYDVSRAFNQLKAYVNVRKKYKSLQRIKFDTVTEAVASETLTFLPYRCPEGCAILLVKVDNWYPSEFPVEDVHRMCLVILTQALRDPMTQVNGIKVIFDVKSNPIRHIRYCTPSNFYLLCYGSQECIGARFKGIHIVNQSLTFKAGWILIKPLLSEKIRKRVVFHSGPETLLNYFPSSTLPIEYGGDLKHCIMTRWLKKVTKQENLAKLIGESIASNESTKN